MLSLLQSLDTLLDRTFLASEDNERDAEQAPKTKSKADTIRDDINKKIDLIRTLKQEIYDYDERIRRYDNIPRYAQWILNQESEKRAAWQRVNSTEKLIMELNLKLHNLGEKPVGYSV